jgi:hypothetical protein
MLGNSQILINEGRYFILFGWNKELLVITLAPAIRKC